ncbi:MAG TPA: ribosome-associated translation inhibitor RaiA [Erysipelotrichaceae bacterium]|nr:ribosome-associated translation inhibitor RaiA [Erysipelotrichia bacterium]HPX32807.1 ribosome-associated translation inhibitor RaiA [Erysipelotrichaceae bacterium]HQA85436.1 ribosome-associated translation inhibitor RaiA [Erysipelotrichaceae bacterium]
MKVNVYSKDLNLSVEDEERIGDKLSFLDKYLLIDPETIANVVVKKHGSNIKLEITIPSKIGYLRSEVVDDEVRNAIDKSIDKLEDQIRRQKTRLSRRHKEKLAKAFIDENGYAEEEDVIARVKRVVVDELDTDEAIIQMELVNHNFFVFRDKDTGLISIIYRREQGDYGILEVV